MPSWASGLLWSLLVSTAVLGANLVPRVTFQHGDPQRSLTQFSLEGVSNYDTFLLSGDEGTLYVGARDTILSLGVGDTGSVVQQGLVSRAREVRQRGSM
uniref:Semaphorin 4A n=1 Tax=Sphenodon punctatus TaxID=8508 RepID=A0A8D0GCE3_SPHPU